MAQKESLSPPVQSSRVFTSTHLWQTVPSGREYNPWGDEPSHKASFFGVFLFPSLTSVLGLRTSSVFATCACNPRNPTPIRD